MKSKKRKAANPIKAWVHINESDNIVYIELVMQFGKCGETHFYRFRDPVGSLTTGIPMKKGMKPMRGRVKWVED